jgi:hypothetical protein
VVVDEKFQIEPFSCKRQVTGPIPVASSIFAPRNVKHHEGGHLEKYVFNAF